MKVYMPGFLLMELLLALSISVLMIIIVGQTLALIYSKSIPWCQLIQLCHETTPAGNSQSSSYPRYCYKEYSESVTITNEFGQDYVLEGVRWHAQAILDKDARDGIVASFASVKVL